MLRAPQLYAFLCPMLRSVCLRYDNEMYVWRLVPCSSRRDIERLAPGLLRMDMQALHAGIFAARDTDTFSDSAMRGLFGGYVRLAL